MNQADILDKLVFILSHDHGKTDDEPEEWKRYQALIKKANGPVLRRALGFAYGWTAKSEMEEVK